MVFTQSSRDLSFSLNLQGRPQQRKHHSQRSRPSPAETANPRSSVRPCPADSIAEPHHRAAVSHAATALHRLGLRHRQRYSSKLRTEIPFSAHRGARAMVRELPRMHTHNANVSFSLLALVVIARSVSKISTSVRATGTVAAMRATAIPEVRWRAISTTNHSWPASFRGASNALGKARMACTRACRDIYGGSIKPSNGTVEQRSKALTFLIIESIRMLTSQTRVER